MRSKVGFLLVVMLINVKIGLYQVSSATFQSFFLYKSIKYLEWPEDHLTNFEIFICGTREIYDELQKNAKSGKAENRFIVIKQSEKYIAPQLCHTVYLKESIQTTAVLNNIENRSILLVKNIMGLSEKFSSLNFIGTREKLFYHLNASSLHEKRIKVSSIISSLIKKCI